MRGLIAVLYIFALGWAVSHYEVDKLWSAAARKAFRALVAEGIQVSAELSYLRPAVAAPPVIYLVPVVLPGGSHG